MHKLYWKKNLILVLVIAFLPDNLKMADITPAYKDDDRMDKEITDL